MEKKTSNEWWLDHTMFHYYRIADPDGWDRGNMHYSWYVEEITYDEFERRLNLSTLVPKIDKV